MLFCNASFLTDGSESTAGAHISGFAVAPEHWGKGFGFATLACFEQLLATVDYEFAQLHVLETRRARGVCTSGAAGASSAGVIRTQTATRRYTKAVSGGSSALRRRPGDIRKAPESRGQPRKSLQHRDIARTPRKVLSLLI